MPFLSLASAVLVTSHLDPWFGLGLPVAAVWAQGRWERGETSAWELQRQEAGWVREEAPREPPLLSGPHITEETLRRGPCILAKCKEQESGAFE